MQLFAAWKDVVALLQPKNFLLFAGAVLLASVRTYTALLPFWWIIPVCACCIHGFSGGFSAPLLAALPSLIGFPCVSLDCTGTLAAVVWWIVLLLYHGVLFLIYLSARPSIHLKNYGYFFSYVRYFLFFEASVLTVHIALCWFLHAGVAATIIHKTLDFNFWCTVPLMWIGSMCVTIFLVGFVVFWVFFFLDSTGSFRDILNSFYRAGMMTILSWPIIMLFFLIYLLCMIGVGAFVDGIKNFFLCRFFHTPALLGTVYLCLIPLPITFFAVLYTKRLYDNSTVYLG